MKQIIQLAEDEIKEALVAYLSTQGVNLENKTTEISFNAGRSGNGHTANIEVNDKSTAKATRTKKPKAAATKETTKVVELVTKEEPEEVVKETTEITELDNNAGTDGDDEVTNVTKEEKEPASDKTKASSEKKSLFS